MFNPQFGVLAIAMLLLSPNFAHARELKEDTNLSVGTVQIRTTDGGTSVKTPNIQIDTLKAPERRGSVSGNRQRYRTTVRRKRTYTPPAIVPPRIDPDDRVTTTMPAPTTGTYTIRSSSTDENGIQTVKEQRQSIRCSGSGISVSQSSTTINGRTVSSQVRSNCQ